MILVVRLRTLFLGGHLVAFAARAFRTVRPTACHAAPAGDRQFADRLLARTQGLLAKHFFSMIAGERSVSIQIRWGLQISAFRSILAPGKECSETIITHSWSSAGRDKGCVDHLYE
jgi:hypothetical protein